MSDADRARTYARMYVQLTEALIAEGVEEDTAREEARFTATTWLLNPEEEAVSMEKCPLCGRGGT